MPKLPKGWVWDFGKKGTPMPLGLHVGGPHDGDEVGVADIQTLPGWEIWSWDEHRDNVRHVYRCNGKQDWQDRWIFLYVGETTAGPEDEQC